MPASKPYFVTLDGMRGIAALMVVALHVGGTLGLNLAPHAYLAVDFFFILSGFVIGGAYDARLKTTMGSLDFARLRVIRLWPLFVLGLGLMAALLCLRALTIPAAIPLGSVLAASAFEVFMIPAPAGLAWDAAPWPLYPVNMPGWSLFFELAANFAYGLVARHLTTARLWGFVMVGALALVASALAYGGLDSGGTWSDVAGGFARVGFGFFLGIALQRLHRGGLHPSGIGSLAACIALVAILALGAKGVVADLAAAFVAFPALVLIGARLDPGKLLTAPMAWLGRISYAIYVLHLPVAFWTLVVLHKLAGDRLPVGATLGVVLVAVLAVATLADRFWDVPVRAALARVSRRRPAFA